MKKVRTLRRGRESFIPAGSSRSLSAVQRTGHAKQPRHRRKRELQADASGGEGIRRKQDRQRRQQRCRRVILSPEQRRKQHQRRHKRRAQHRRTSARHDREHDHQRQTDDSGRAPVSGKEAQKAQQKRQMQPRDRDRVHDAGRAQRNVEILRVERGLIAEHERLRKRQHVRRERRLCARLERMGNGFRPVEPAVCPDAGMCERALLNVADKIDSLGGIGIRLRPIALCGWAKLHLRRDFIAGAQRCRFRVGDIEPRFAGRHIRACEQHGQPAAVLIGNGILRHARRDRLHITGDVLRGCQAHGRGRSVPPEADRRRQQRQHHAAARRAREQQRRERKHDRCQRRGKRPVPRQQKVRQKDRSRKTARAICQLSHAVAPSFSADIINKIGGRNKSRRRISFAYSSFSPIGAPPRTWKCR